MEALPEKQPSRNVQKQMLKAVAEGIFSVDVDDNVTYVNPAASTLLGWKAEELIGKSMHRLTHHTKPDGNPFPEDECPVIKTSKDGETHREEDIFWKKDGSQMQVQYLSAPIRDEQGNVTGAVVTFSDVTERKKEDEEGRRRDERFRLIFENAKELVTIGTLDGTAILILNKAGEDITGYTREEINEMGGWRTAFFPEPRMRAEALSIVERSAKGELSHVDFPMVRKDGRTVWISWSLAPIPIGVQETGILAFGTDITARKTAEEERKTALLYARSLIEASLDPIVTIARDGRILDGNKAMEDATGLNREEIIGSEFSNYFTQPDKADGVFKGAFDKGYVRDYPLAIRHTSGRVTDVLYNATVMREAPKADEIVFASARDVSAQKQAEETIVRQQRAIRELSTPVLQIRHRLLILPIIGMIEADRARQLTEQLLVSIRETRAKVAVMDVTGVPTIDSKVANHLVQAIEASRLMGATVVITGVSPEIAQALVHLGIDLSKLNSVGDLQSGIETAEAILRERSTKPSIKLKDIEGKDEGQSRKASA